MKFYLRLFMRDKDKTNLLGMLEAINRIKKYVKSITNSDDFFKNEVVYDAVLMNFVVIGEMSERISKKLKNKHDKIEWTKIKDFRNIIAHDYFGIDAQEVWEIIHTDLKQLKTELEIIIENINGS